MIHSRAFYAIITHELTNEAGIFDYVSPLELVAWIEHHLEQNRIVVISAIKHLGVEASSSAVLDALPTTGTPDA